MSLTFEEYKKLRELGTPPEQIDVNPEKPQRGYAGEIIPAIGSIGGASLGRIGGTAAGAAIGGLVGGPPGALVGGTIGFFGGRITGAGAGGSIGETIQQEIERIEGTRQEFDPGQIATTGITAAATEGLFMGAGRAIKPVWKTLSPTREGVVKLLGKFSGFSKSIVTKLMERSPTTIAAVKGGEKVLDDVIILASQKFHQFADITLKNAQKIVQQLHNKMQIKAPTMVTTAANDMRDTINGILTRQHRIKILKGILDFVRPGMPSRIVSVTEQNAIQESYDLMESLTLPGRFFIKNIDAILERMIVLTRKTAAGTPTGPETKKIIGQMINVVKDGASKSYYEYGIFLKQNLQKNQQFT